jgi:hypothetical protein
MRQGTVMSVAVVVLMVTVVGLSAAALRAAWQNQVIIDEQRSTANLAASIDAIERFIVSGGEQTGRVEWLIGKQSEQSIAMGTATRTVFVNWKTRYDTRDIEIIAEEVWGQKTVRSLRKVVTNERVE